jgi:hypothetical protein
MINGLEEEGDNNRVVPLFLFDDIKKRLEKGYLLTKKEQADSVLFKEKEDE